MPPDMPKIKPKPTRPCFVCGSYDWWLRKVGFGAEAWLCGRCHPNPNKEVSNARENRIN